MDFGFEGHNRCVWIIGIQMRTETTLAAHCGAMVRKSGLKIAQNGCFYKCLNSAEAVVGWIFDLRVTIDAHGS
jgi:hypothetical protein